MELVMSIAGYERKAELGGGFRGTVVHAVTNERRESEVLPTLEGAKHWAQVEAHRLMGGRPYRRAAVAKRFTGGSYRANIWA